MRSSGRAETTLQINRFRPRAGTGGRAVGGSVAHSLLIEAFELLPDEEQQPYRSMLAEIILGHQEPNGCWWDFPMYNYHRQYGTAFALMTLHRTIDAGDNK